MDSKGKGKVLKDLSGLLRHDFLQAGCYCCCAINSVKYSTIKNMTIRLAGWLIGV